MTRNNKSKHTITQTEDKIHDIAGRRKKNKEKKKDNTDIQIRKIRKIKTNRTNRRHIHKN